MKETDGGETAVSPPSNSLLRALRLRYTLRDRGHFKGSLRDAMFLKKTCFKQIYDRDEPSEESSATESALKLLRFFILAQ